MTPDETLFEAFRKRDDRDALDTLFRRHLDRVYRITRRVLRHDADASDATQAAFLNVIRHAHTWNARTPFEGWLYRIAMNAALQRAKSRKREDRVGNNRPTFSSTPNPEDFAMENESTRQVEQAVEALPEEYRFPLQLHYYEGLSYDRIAETLECPVGTVGTRLHRGIERLRTSLAASGVALTVAALTDVMQKAEGAVTPPSLIEAVSRVAHSAPHVSAVTTATGAAAAATAGLVPFLSKLLLAACILLTVFAFFHFQDSVKPDPGNPALARKPVKEGEDAAKAVSKPVPTPTESGASSGAKEATAPEWGLTGRVLGPGGVPLAGASVSASEAIEVFGGSLSDTTVHPNDVFSLIPPSPSDSEMEKTLKLLQKQNPELAGIVGAARGSSYRANERKSAVTDSKGRYRLTAGVEFMAFGVASGEGRPLSVVVRASHPSAAVGTLTVKDVARGKDREFPDLVLSAGGVLSGVVTDREGVPLSDINIHLQMRLSGPMGEMMSSHLPGSLPVGRTDTTGRFRLERVPPGVLTLGAGGQGYAFGMKKIPVDSGTGRADVVLQLRKGRTFEGIVTDSAGRPIPKVVMILNVGELITSFSGIQVTEDDGRFRFDGIPSGTGTLILQAQNYRGESIDWPLPESQKVLVLRKPGILAGRVVDRKTGKPVESFEIFFSVEAGIDLLVPDEKGEQGSFRVEMNSMYEEQDYFVTIRAAGYAPKASGPHPMKFEQTTDVGAIELEAGLSLKGVVVSPDGKPVSDALVAVAHADEEWNPFPPSGEDEMKVNRDFHRDHALSNTRGEFQIQNLRPGTYDLRVWHFAYPPTRFPAAAAGGDGIRIGLTRGGHLEGGLPAPVDKLYVEVKQADQEKRITLKEDGSFYVGPLPAGTYEILVRKESGSFFDETVDRGTVAVTEGGTVRWSPSGTPTKGVAIHGTIWTEEGKLAVDYQVAFVSPSGSMEELHLTTTDKEGRFHVPAIQPGRYYAAAFASIDDIGKGTPYRPVEVTQNGTDLEIRIPPRTCAAKGVLVDLKGTPMAAADLEVRYAGETNDEMIVGSATTTPEGTFKVERLPAGRYDLHLGSMGQENRKLLLTFEVSDNQELDLGLQCVDSP